MASCENFQKLLAERTRQASLQDITDLEKFKSEVLSFIEANQSFEGILFETYNENDSKQSLKQLESIDISSKLVAPDCVSMLKSQARQASCSLDLLAAEMLSKKLYQAVQTCEGEHTQFLNDKMKAVMSTIILIIKMLLKENSFNRVHFAKCLSSQHQDHGYSLPLEVLWLLHTNHIASFNTYLACCSYNSASCSSLVNGLIDICETSLNVPQDKQVEVLKVFVRVLLPLANKDTTTTEKRSNLEKVAVDVLESVVHGRSSSCTTYTGGNKEISRLDIFEVIRDIQDLPEQTVMAFFNDQFHNMLFKPSPESTVSGAVIAQSKWNFASLSEQTRTRYQQFLYMFKPSVIMEQISQAFTRKEVNWQVVLSFLAVYLVCIEEAEALIKNYTDILLQDAMVNCDSHTMSVLLLVIRQASQEGPHVFPSYLTWFKSKFGNAATTPLNIKKTIQFFVEFLTELVPYEPSYYLKVHIIKSPQVPAKLRSIVHDYDALARTRLMDLKEPVELTGLYEHESPVMSNSDEKTEQQKLQEQAHKEVDKALDSYSKTGKVPGSVMEASIFRKPYFIGRFLPALLTPRKLPESPDTRTKLINTLSKAGKISTTMLEAYYKACERMAFDLGDSQDDDIILSDVEKLKKNLNSLTQDVVHYMQNNNKTTRTSISAKISLLASHIKSMVKTVQNIPCTSPVVIDMGSPSLDDASIQVVDMLLNTFCQMCLAARALSTSDHSRSKWSADFVAMVVSVPAIHVSLYFRLWDLLCSKGALSLTIQHIQGLAAFLCHLSSHKTPIILMNHDSVVINKQQENALSIVETIFSLVPISTSEWMEFTIRLCCSYLQHAAESFSDILLLPSDMMQEVAGKCTCLVPQSLVKKLWYLMHRFSFCAFCRQDCKSYDCIIDIINKVKATALYQRLSNESQKVSFDEWLTWELSVQRDEDILAENDRAQYHDATVLGYFLPLSENDGGCDNSYRTVCTLIVDRILEAKKFVERDNLNRCHHDGQKHIARKLCTQDLISLLERILHLMLQKPDTSQLTSEAGMPWLLCQYNRRIDKLKKENHTVDGTPVGVLAEHETRAFIDVMLCLPPYLIFCDNPDKSLADQHISSVASFVNNGLRYTGVTCCLPVNITVHLLKGLVTISKEKDSSVVFNEPIIKQFCQECPMFFISLQFYWQHISVMVTCILDNNNIPSVLQDAQTLHHWIESFCSGSIVSKATPMAYPPWIFAPCIYLGLQNIKNPVECIQKLFNTTDSIFMNKISVCLFACVLSSFKDMVLHGQEISKNKNAWEVAMELLKCCPNVLACFMEESNNNDELQKLRALILPDSNKLLPVVYFSLLTECPQVVIEKVKTFPQFPQVTIKMNKDFTELRKMCLENQEYKSCEKPFQIEFAGAVFQFLRLHTRSYLQTY